jgi:hypothetical protein
MLVYYSFCLLSVIITLYSKFQEVITLLTVQNWTHVYMNFSDHDLGNHLLQ